MQRGKSAKKSSMGDKGGMKTSRSMTARVAGKKIAGKKIVGKKAIGKKAVGKMGVRKATSGARIGKLEEGSGPRRGLVTGAGSQRRRPRKSDI